MLAPEFLTHWRTTIVRDREIVEAVVRPEHLGPSPALQAALANWPGMYYWASGADADRLVLVRPTAPPRRERWALHAALFLLTFLTVQLGGAILLGGSVHTLPSLSGGWERLLGNVEAWGRASLAGIPFAMALMAILLAHEMGHYLTAKRYAVDASPPFFLPAPIEWTFIGTFGAFIRLRSPVVDRRQLLEIGAAGPWVGFGVALIVLIVGMQQAWPADVVGGAPMVIQWREGYLWIGDSLITWVVRHAFAGEGTVVLNPLAAAGWIGMLVTALNLLPIGQLDGGHIIYALFGRYQRHAAVVAWVGLLVLGRWFWPWWLMAGLTLVLGGGRITHPKVLEWRRPLPASRLPLGWASIALFLLTFAWVPIKI
ncbi:MAG: site-2 protease family protein [Gemmatimonadota bacterium]|nr:site-2 protease family protein [Gemmatimonadota bacterium]